MLQWKKKFFIYSKQQKVAYYLLISKDQFLYDLSIPED